MAIAVASTATGAWTSTTVVINKPTGLAEGDLMIACLNAEDGAIATLSGWTLLGDTGSANGNSNIQYKVATAGDVAASNFSFSVDSGSITGAILRVTGFAPTALFSDFETEVDTNSATQFNWGVTLDPITNGELVIVCGTANTLTSASGAVSAPTINGTNPSWTEVLDSNFNQGGGFYAVGYVAYAIQATATQITSFTATVSNTGSSTDGAGVIATLSPQINATVTHPTLTQSPTFTKPTLSVGVNPTTPTFTMSPTINTPSVYGNAPSRYTNPDKPSTTWTNPDKP